MALKCMLIGLLPLVYSVHSEEIFENEEIDGFIHKALSLEHYYETGYEDDFGLTHKLARDVFFEWDHTVINGSFEHAVLAKQIGRGIYMFGSEDVPAIFGFEGDGAVPGCIHINEELASVVEKIYKIFETRDQREDKTVDWKRRRTFQSGEIRTLRDDVLRWLEVVPTLISPNIQCQYLSKTLPYRLLYMALQYDLFDAAFELSLPEEKIPNLPTHIALYPAMKKLIRKCIDRHKLLSSTTTSHQDYLSGVYRVFDNFAWRKIKSFTEPDRTPFVPGNDKSRRQRFFDEFNRVADKSKQVQYWLEGTTILAVGNSQGEYRLAFQAIQKIGYALIVSERPVPKELLKLKAKFKDRCKIITMTQDGWKTIKITDEETNETIDNRS
ncbi:unnamed protein product [Albugo candida]|uniref:Uncharacterized protein n=1 Tax=Albugo candida TaxID=65357 RepID=A0A024GKG6_9STRA|nr:unnamed protein product [Albugo candida]|eukprot:CCI46824.1 unnamed protein product [Albugo candida]